MAPKGVLMEVQWRPDVECRKEVSWEKSFRERRKIERSREEKGREEDGREEKRDGGRQ